MVSIKITVRFRQELFTYSYLGLHSLSFDTHHSSIQEGRVSEVKPTKKSLTYKIVFNQIIKFKIIHSKNNDST